MESSLWTAISGLNASSRQMDVIGNNIANVNTIGFKAGVPVFSDILSQSIAGGSGSMQIGRGVGLSAIPTLFGQGSFESTRSATDLAIDGDGFFMVNDADGATYYTRAGMFTIDKDGCLVNVNGYKVQGYMYEDGVFTDAVGDIALGGIQSVPEVTTRISIGTNLNGETAENDTFVSALTVYDSLGAAHTLSLTFTKNANDGEWDMGVEMSDLDPVDGLTLSSTTIAFDLNGKLVGTTADIDITVTGAMTGGATIGDSGVIRWDLVDDDGDGDGKDAEVMTGYASPSVNRSLVSNGHSSGELKSLSVGSDGVLNGFFSNGQTADIGQIALAKFANPWGLNKMGSNLFAATTNSGDALINKPGTAGLGEINPNSLEMANTDIATEFINMITAQRAYQASAKVITTTDQMISDLMNIKR
ncbi:MAG: flagellar hook protein FlgE [Thermodesulfobacteriota bacterium]|nr:flagellar hook protein FlgE [Thermodesulfobacteriota bacterium]